MDEPELIARVNAYRRTFVHGAAEPIARPPLTVFVHPAGSAPGASRAVPDGPIVGDAAGPLAEALAVMSARGLRPCVELLDRLAPALPPALAAGAEALFLVADHAAAARVYARVGFRPLAELVRYEPAAG